MQGGYLQLSSTYLRANPSFTLHLPLAARFISPHPFTNQDTVTIARGPMIYCLEDVDNAWVTDHFKTVLFDPTSTLISERTTTDSATGETYVELTAKGGITFIDVAERPNPAVSVCSISASPGDLVRQLVFVPYYFRANRTGKGHMRVGLKRNEALSGAQR